MPHEEILHRVSRLAGQIVCALALIVLAGRCFHPEAFASVQPGTLLTPLTSGLALLLAGASLWLQHHGERLRAARAAAIGVLILSLVSLGATLALKDPSGARFIFLHGLNGGTALYLALAGVMAGLALLVLHRSEELPPPTAPTWLAAAVLAIAGGSIFSLCRNPELTGAGVDFLGPIALSAYTGSGLLLLGGGLICARPQDALPLLFFAPTPEGRVARRALVIVLLAPAFLTATLLALRGGNFNALPAGVPVLAMVYLVGGLTIALFSVETAIGLSQQRQHVDQTQGLFTARLQEQAAQLQQTVGQRTHELREANLHLQALNQRLELATHASSLGIWEWDNVSQRSQWDKRTLEIYGLQPGEYDGTGEGWIRCLHPDDQARAREASAKMLAGSDEYVLIFRIIRPDGEVRHVESRGIVLRDAQKRVTRVIGTERDITAQLEATLQTQLLNERLQLALRSSNYGVWELDLATRKNVWDDRMFEIYGVRRADFDGNRSIWLSCVHPADLAAAEAAIQGTIDGQAASYQSEFRIVRPDGQVRHIEAHGYVQRDAAGRPHRLAGLNRDITAEKALQEALHMAEQRWQLAIEGTNDAVWDWNIESGFVYHDEHWARMLGFAADEVTASLESWRKLVHPDDLAASEAAAQEHLEQRCSLYQHEYRMRTKNGEWRWILDRGKVVSRAPDGRPLRMVGTHSDITARKSLEQRLRRTEELAEQVSRLALIGGWELDLATSQLAWSSGARRIFELEDNAPLTLADALEFFPPDARATFQTALLQAGAEAKAFDLELPLNTAHGRRAWVRVLGRTESGPERPVRIHGAIQDITAKHESETARRLLETQLFHAQKMETLGTLAGGIAHDFNNLLTGIIGYHELAADSVPEDHPARACLAEARHASLRARELVDQILTFGRQSSGESHEPADLSVVIEEARRFLRATLPATISIKVEVAPDCGHVLADTTQIHQVLLNLGSNSAHAMRAQGGVLTIRLQRTEISADRGAALGGVPAGGYVRLSVSDTGHGMDETTMQRIFDPFFTTKNTREGTGLGLAVVHGIVRAHRGAINVESEVGAGATFHIYLPALAEANPAAAVVPVAAPAGTGQLVWVVDDENIVVHSTRVTLEKKGFRVTAFSSSEKCLAALRENPGGCHALITDQTMPGMQGTELAAAARALIPGLPVVIMSGYFSKIPTRALDELGRVELLAKPFTSDELAQTLHRALHPAERVT